MKKKILVLFGGQSSEHEVSLLSATNIIRQLDSDLFEIILVGITKEGQWLSYEGPVEAIADGSWEKSQFVSSIVLSPDRTVHGLITEQGERIFIDVAFPVLHGLYGEDGTVQGIFKLAGIPCVGCMVAASAISMDKVLCKLALKGAGILQAPFVALTTHQLKTKKEEIMKEAIDTLGLPIFVKPANAGSSVGISKAHSKEELEKAITLAAKHDRKILLETTIVGREIECAVLGNEEAFASPCGEIIAGQEFYDYEAKYGDVGSKTVVPAPLPLALHEKIQAKAKEIYEILGCEGFSRVDFFVTEQEEIIFNEINTIPGFTPISMYPMMMEAGGISKKELVQKLVDLALEEGEKK